MAKASSPPTRESARPSLSKRGEALAIGLTGEIGGGKSAVASLLAERGALVIDADVAGHETLRRPDVRARLVERFGSGVLTTKDGEPQIDRRELGALVFADSEALRDLEAIVHPIMAERFRRQIAEARRSPGAGPIVIDAAVLFEAGWDGLCDCVLYVEAPRAARLERVARRGWSAADLKAREAAQWSGEAKAGRADYVLSNAGSLDDLGAAVDRFLAWLSARDEIHHRSPPPEPSPS